MTAFAPEDLFAAASEFHETWMDFVTTASP